MIPSSTETPSSCGMQPQGCQCKKPSIALQIIEVISRVSLAIFSAVISPVTFAISFFTGVAIGVGIGIYQLIKEQASYYTGNQKPACSESFMTYLSGMQWPAEISLAVTTLFIGAHIRHDPTFFVPFCSSLIGIWAGRHATIGCYDLGTRLVAWIKKKQGDGEQGLFVAS